MHLIPTDLGPVDPKVEEVAVAAALIGALCLLVGRLVTRAGRVLAGRSTLRAGTPGAPAGALPGRRRTVRVLGEGKLLSESRRGTGRAGRRAAEDGAALVVAAPADAPRDTDGGPATEQARGEAERAAAEAELRGQVSEWASELASRIAAEPLTGPPLIGPPVTRPSLIGPPVTGPPLIGPPVTPGPAGPTRDTASGDGPDPGPEADQNPRRP
ncbi:hypothetical protein [Streptomyces sp. NPDC047123]|uniref:hypothetical protein n=1 Tax=Streptomyces sp. NPDC047123 TaxID=3155622 RepID=UPI0033F3157B